MEKILRRSVLPDRAGSEQVICRAALDVSGFELVDLVQRHVHLHEIRDLKSDYHDTGLTNTRRRRTLRRNLERD